MFARKPTFARKHMAAAMVVAGALALGVSTGSAQAQNAAKSPPHLCGVYYQYTC
jgi:Spy/CpxP family protein refolding chaperone